MTSSYASFRKKNDFVNNGWKRCTNGRGTSLNMRSSHTMNESYKNEIREKIRDSELFGARSEKALLDLIIK